MAGIKDIIGKIIGGATENTLGGIANVVDKFITTPDEKKKFLLDIQEQIEQHNSAILKAAADADTAQNEVNKIEAQSSSLFVAGWRPFIGWICGSGLAIQFIVNPLATFTCATLGHPIQFPLLETGTMIQLLVGMLGLGAMRTYEKLQGVSYSLTK